MLTFSVNDEADVCQLFSIVIRGFSAYIFVSANKIPLKRCTVRPAYAIFFLFYFKSTEIVADASLSLLAHRRKNN